MTRETKVGLLVGMGVILLIGIIVSDHLSMSNKPQPVDMTDYAPMAQNSLNAAGTGMQQVVVSNSASTPPVPATPLPTPDQLDRLPAARGEHALAQQSNPVQPPAYTSNPTPAQNHDALADALASGDLVPVPSRPAANPGATLVNGDLNDVTLSSRDVVPQRPSAGPQPGIHYVQRNETLYAIAARYYGDGAYWPVIRHANPGAIKPDNTVNLGVRLVIPNKAVLPEIMKQMPDWISEMKPQPEDVARLAQPTRPANANRSVTVETGDTLTGLAAKHLGSASQWRDLLNANKDILDDPKDLRVGMVLRLPADRSASPAANTPRQASPQQQASATTTYTVQSGDSLYRIAEKQLGDGKLWRRIFEANRHQLKSANDVRAGMKLTIPTSR